MLRSLVGSEMCIRDRCQTFVNGSTTQAVIFDFAMLDPYQSKDQSITSCTVLAENPMDSKVFMSIDCGTIGSVEKEFDIILTVMVVFYFLVEAFSMQQMRWKYLTNPWKLLDIAQLVLLVTYLIIRAGVAVRMDEVLWDLDELDYSTAVKIAGVRQVTVTMNTVFGVATFLNVLKALRYMGFFPLLSLPILTIINAGWQLISFAILTFILILAFAAMAFMVMAPFRVEYWTLGRSVLSMIASCVAGPNHAYYVRDLPAQYQWYINVTTTFFRFFMYFVMLPIVVAVVAYAYNSTKTGFKKVFIDTERLHALWVTFRSRPVLAWLSRDAIWEMRRMDHKYVEERAQKQEEAKRKSLNGNLHMLATDLQNMIKSIEHAAVRLTVLNSLDKQIEMLHSDFKMTHDVVIPCMKETHTHLERQVAEKQTASFLQSGGEHSQSGLASPRKRGSSRASKKSSRGRDHDRRDDSFRNLKI
eukprot:TRINITY_DN26445_c0_g1_i4.p1 TRINITY_DN26445_c0_g1~~TRINITY_DN26445_c0_g1_i4.p1  ORF type:complete len:515 (+),score=113.03 TRINITY_DN26445_c0_g1_i4:132-1547(+)